MSQPTLEELQDFWETHHCGDHPDCEFIMKIKGKKVEFCCEKCNEIEKKKENKNEIISSLYCKSCKTQCRNKTEYSFHINSAKHKNLLTPKQTIFTCVECNYTTTFKQHYEKHITTKTHFEKVKKSELVID